MEQTIEYRIVNDEELPPIVISMNGDNLPKIVLNQHHKIWLSLHRKVIAGGAQGLFDQIDKLLTAHLEEVFAIEQMDGEYGA
jgi:hypothetical protein